jgi:hypothetical protein
MKWQRCLELCGGTAYLESQGFLKCKLEFYGKSNGGFKKRSKMI